MKTIRIGSGAGYGGDRLDPALELIEKGNLDYIGFECLAERTIALAQREKRQDASRGYNPLLEHRMEKVLPLIKQHGVKVITNMGAANPEEAMKVICQIANSLGITGLKVAAVLGDDIYEQIDQYLHLPIIETGNALHTIQHSIVSANAYLGVAPIVEALRKGADVIITGRVADPALFLAPLIYEFGWKPDDYDKIGKGTLIGHLLECAGQVCGGYFADPRVKDVPDLWNLGFPLVEVDESGEGIISKVSGTGGIVSKATCTEQLLYEIHDPSKYYTPDCVADFSKVNFQEVEKDVIAFSGAGGQPATDTYKVSVGYQNGFFGTGEISYGGVGCVRRAELAADIIQKRLAGLPIMDLRCDFIGINAIQLLKKTIDYALAEVRLRVSGRTAEREIAQMIANEVEALYTNGPAGGGGASKKVEEVISVASVLIPKSAFNPRVVYQQI